MKSKKFFLSYGNTLGILEWWLLITVVLVAMAALSCLGGFGLSCQTSALTLLGWIGLSVAIGVLAILAAASLISDRPGG